MDQWTQNGSEVFKPEPPRPNSNFVMECIWALRLIGLPTKLVFNDAIEAHRIIRAVLINEQKRSVR